MRGLGRRGLVATTVSLLLALPASASIHIDSESDAIASADRDSLSPGEGNSDDSRLSAPSTEVEPASAPAEPMTWAMMLLGFAAVSVARLGKKPSEVRYRMR